MTLVLTAGIKLTLGKVSCYTLDAGCSAVGLARSVWDAEVGGSNPLTPTILIDVSAPVMATSPQGTQIQTFPQQKA